MCPCSTGPGHSISLGRACWCCWSGSSPLQNGSKLSHQKLPFTRQPKAAADDLGTPTIAAIHQARQANAICNSFLPGQIALKQTCTNCFGFGSSSSFFFFFFFFFFLVVQNPSTVGVAALGIRGSAPPCFQAGKNASQLPDKVILPSGFLSLLFLPFQGRILAFPLIEKTALQ